MGISEHPPQGALVIVDFTNGFTQPEMTKRRLAVVLTPRIKARPFLVTVVPLSLSDPEPVMPYHHRIAIPFEMPAAWGKADRWVKGDMVNAVGFHRIGLLRLGKGIDGKRHYQTQALPEDTFRIVRQCVLHGLGLSTLTKHL